MHLGLDILTLLHIDQQAFYGPWSRTHDAYGLFVVYVSWGTALTTNSWYDFHYFFNDFSIELIINQYRLNFSYYTNRASLGIFQIR